MEEFEVCNVCGAHVRTGAYVRAPWWDGPKEVCLSCVVTLASTLAGVVKITDVFSHRGPQV